MIKQTITQINLYHFATNIIEIPPMIIKKYDHFRNCNITRSVSIASLFYLVCEAIGTVATPGLLCQPRVIVKMIMEKQMECRLVGGNRSSRIKPAPAPLLPITKSHMTRPGFEPGPPRWEAGDESPEL
jgi:hypothetical protein